jgi:hypothetical protein
VDTSIAGEWSFAQTLRHLVHATDLWLGKAVLRQERPFHELGLGHGETATDTPSYDAVLAARAGRVAMVRDFLDMVTPAELDEERPNPHDPEHTETVRHCLQVVLQESWEHLRFAVRDLDIIESGPHLP